MHFEIHITVQADDFIALKQVCLDCGLGYILVKNEYGRNPWQLIITKWTERKTREEAIRRAQDLATFLRSKQLTVIRVKVEHEIDKLDDTYTLQGDEYFEFHVKIPVKTSELYPRLKTLGLSHQVVWSTLVQSKSLDFMPISTLRFKQPSFSVKEAMLRKQKWIEELNANGISISSKLHQELCIFDDNVKLDEGWEGPMLAPVNSSAGAFTKPPNSSAPVTFTNPPKSSVASSTVKMPSDATSMDMFGL